MKTLNFLIILLLLTTTGRGQILTILPLNTTDFPDGAYMKDLDNVLPFWTGTWEGVSGNQKFTLEISSFPEQHFQTPYANYYQDRIAGKFKITIVPSGQIIYNTLAVSSYQNYPIMIVPFLNSSLDCTFQDDASNCNVTADFILTRIPGQLNQIKYTMFSRVTYNPFLEGCSQYDNVMQIPMPLPTTDLILYRQP